MPGGINPASNRELVLLLNEIQTQFNALLVKLDADTGAPSVADTDYAALHTSTATKLPVPPAN